MAFLINVAKALAYRVPLALLPLLLACSDARASGNFLLPSAGHISGGNWVSCFFRGPEEPEKWTYYFGDTPALAAQGSDGLYLLVPPADTPGTVDFCYEFADQPGVSCVAGAYTYYAAPKISSMTPKEQSFLPDPFTVTFRAVGLSIYPGIKVIFGNQSASNVEYDYDRGELYCTPPPFPEGSPIPLTVDVRVINPGGGETVLPGAYTYKQIIPRIKRIDQSKIPSFRTGREVFVFVDRVLLGAAQVYFDGIPAFAKVYRDDFNDYNFIVATPPPHAQGKVDVTVFNADGGTYTAKNAFEYTGTASTNFHSSDTDKNFRISISEILRAVQLFNSDGFHCDATSEDGYASGLEGDQTCMPHASDYDPQDWKLSLPELLQLIQFYNLFCYEPCTSDPSGYCPPIDYRETRP